MYVYLAAFIPGLFLEFCVLLANPELACELAARSHEGFASGRYITMFVALFFAYVIGNALMMMVNFAQLAVNIVYRIRRFLWEQFQKHVVLPHLTELTHTPGKRQPWWVYDLHRRLSDKLWYYQRPEQEAAFRWWKTLAKQLLLKRYGLSEELLPAASFSPLRYVLTIPTAEEIRGSVLVNALHATGWAGLVACKYAPLLRNRLYVSFAVFLILFGLFHDFYVARNLFDPEVGDLLRIRAILREFPKIQPPKTFNQEHGTTSGEAELDSLD
jgi:hypothetical protein